MMKRKGQGSFLEGDIPSIIMITVSIGFFLSSVYLANNDFQSKKANIDREAALVEAASTFLKENAKIKGEDLQQTSEYWADKLEKITRTYGVNIYVELKCVDTRPLAASVCSHTYTYGDPPADITDTLSKRFPIALVGDTDLDVYPALIKVSVYRGEAE